MACAGSGLAPPVRARRPRFVRALLFDAVYKNPLPLHLACNSLTCYLHPPTHLPSFPPSLRGAKARLTSDSVSVSALPLCLPCPTAPASAPQLLPSQDGGRLTSDRLRQPEFEHQLAILAAQHRMVPSMFCPFGRYLLDLPHLRRSSPLLSVLEQSNSSLRFPQQDSRSWLRGTGCQRSRLQCHCSSFTLATAQYYPRSRRCPSYAPSSKPQSDLARR